LRWWQRLSLGAFATQAAAVEGSADATKAAVDGAADAAASTSQAAEASGESLSRTLTEQTRRTRTQAESSASVVLDSGGGYRDRNYFRWGSTGKAHYIR